MMKFHDDPRTSRTPARVESVLAKRGEIEFQPLAARDAARFAASTCPRILTAKKIRILQRRKLNALALDGSASICPSLVDSASLGTKETS
jgi:hypothetical protein